MKQKKVLKILTVLLFMILLVCMNSFTVEAASKKEKALKAYNKMLSQSSFKVNISTMTGEKTKCIKYKTANCSFAVLYIDNDSVPELIVKNLRDGYHAIGYGAIFTYKNGKIKQVDALSLNNSFKYYKKKGVFIDNYSVVGYSWNSYIKLSNGKAKFIVGTGKNIANPGSKKTEYVDANGKTISKSTFNKILKKHVKSSKALKVKFISNTTENRGKHLK